MANTARGFKEIHVTNFSSQPTKQRFPSLGAPFENIGAPDFDDHDSQDSDEEGQMPHIAEWRSNLVALSQRRNLYFAAYRDTIHVTIPRGLKQILPGKPDLVLNLPVSDRSITVGGYIDVTRPHCVNHMIIGNLGTHEILLMGCDDGDVLAYYTHVIGNVLDSRDNGGHGGASIAPFFHENVGMTAWGLAIHQQSRLIAVSTNLKEVTVFVPALISEIDQISEPVSIASFVEVDAAYRSSLHFRSLNCCRVLKLPPLEGHNMPSIDFSSDLSGEADSVLAIDIEGNLWIFGIWNEEKKRIHGIHGSEARDGGGMGWGVLSIALEAFKPTATPQEALGMRDINCVFSADELGDKMQPFFNITSSTTLVKDNNATMTWPPVSSSPTTGPGLILDNDESEPWTASTAPYSEPTRRAIATHDSEEDTEFEGASLFPRPRVGPAIFPRSTSPESPISFKYKPDSQKRPLAIRSKEATECFDYMVNMPAGAVESLKSSNDLSKILQQHIDSNRQRGQIKPTIAVEQDYTSLPLLTDKTAIVRAYQYDVELIPMTNSLPRTICKQVVKRSLPPALAGLGPFKRLCFLSSIPELSLLIVGSQAGRVALMTCTRPDLTSIHGPVVTFRLDLILPGKKQEDGGMKPNLPLFGLAVGPLQAKKGIGMARSRRLILHYYDHTVLSYELSRDEVTNEL